MAATFTILGRLGQDVETRHTGSGLAVSTLNVATNKRVKDNNSGEWKEETLWHRLTLWRHDGLLPHLLKGRQVFATGQIEPGKYEKDGETKFVTNFVIDTIELVGQRGSGDAKSPAPATHAQTGGEASDDVPF